jgi:hypothetical protein
MLGIHSNKAMKCIVRIRVITSKIKISYNINKKEQVILKAEKM